MVTLRLFLLRAFRRGGRRQGVVHKAHAVSGFKADTGRNYRICAVIIAPIRHVRHACAETTLIQPVLVKLAVECRLRVARTHDNFKQVLHHRTGYKPVGFPALAAFPGVCSEVGGADACRGHSQHSELRGIRCRSFRVVPCGKRGAVAATVLFRVTDYRAEFRVRPVHHRRIHPADAACRYIDARLARYRGEGHGKDGVVPLFPCREVVGVPAPHALPHAAVQGCRAAVLELRAVNRVELPPLAVVGHEVTAKAELLRQVTQRLQAAVITGCRRRAVRLVPITTGNGVARRFHGLAQHHLPGFTAFVHHLNLHVAHRALRVGQVADALAVLECGEQLGDFLFLFCC